MNAYVWRVGFDSVKTVVPCVCYIVVFFFYSFFLFAWHTGIMNDSFSDSACAYLWVSAMLGFRYD